MITMSMIQKKNYIFHTREILAKKTEVILTGRQAPPEIIEAADLVTEMKEIKHYFTTKGITSRKGIEN